METTRIKLQIPISFNKPNANGCVYTEEAITKAVCNINENNLPILYKSDDTEKVIGSIYKGCRTIHWDFENQVCNLELDGALFSSGANIMINEIKDGKVTDFKIMNIGINGECI